MSEASYEVSSWKENSDLALGTPAIPMQMTLDVLPGIDTFASAY